MEADFWTLRLAGEPHRPRRPVLHYIWTLTNWIFQWYYRLFCGSFKGPDRSWCVVHTQDVKKVTRRTRQLSHTRTANLNKFPGLPSPLIIISQEKSHFLLRKNILEGKNINSHPFWWISDFRLWILLKIFEVFLQSKNISKMKCSEIHLMICHKFLF